MNVAVNPLIRVTGRILAGDEAELAGVYGASERQTSADGPDKT